MVWWYENEMMVMSGHVDSGWGRLWGQLGVDSCKTMQRRRQRCTGAMCDGGYVRWWGTRLYGFNGLWVGVLDSMMVYVMYGY